MANQNVNIKNSFFPLSQLADEFYYTHVESNVKFG